MKKHQAIQMLGGTPKFAAEAIGITRQAIYMWPDDLSPIVQDRVMAAFHRITAVNVITSRKAARANNRPKSA